MTLRFSHKPVLAAVSALSVLAMAAQAVIGERAAETYYTKTLTSSAVIMLEALKNKIYFA